MAPRRLLLAAGVLLAAVVPDQALAAADCTAPACGTPVSLPFELPFSADAGGAAGTGFTLTEPGVAGAGLRPDLLAVDAATGQLRVTTTNGIAYRAINSQDNMLGVTVPAEDSAIILETTIEAPPPGTGAYEQAGLWYGTSQRDYVKLVLISRDGVRLHMLQEGGDLVKTSIYGPVLPAPVGRVVLRLRINPSDGQITGAYAVDERDPVQLRRTPFSEPLREVADGRRVARAGVFATHRRAAAPVVFAFGAFGVRCAAAACAAGPLPPDPGVGDGTDPVGEPDEGEGGEGDPGGGITPPPPRGGGGGGGRTVTPTLPRRVTPAPSPATPGTMALSVRPRMTRKQLRSRGVRGRVRCSMTCVVRVDVMARPRGGARLRRMGRASVSVSASGSRGVAFGFSRRVRRRLSGVPRLVVRASARFAGGKTAVARRSVRIRTR